MRIGERKLWKVNFRLYNYFLNDYIFYNEVSSVCDKNGWFVKHE